MGGSVGSLVLLAVVVVAVVVVVKWRNCQRHGMVIPNQYALLDLQPGHAQC